MELKQMETKQVVVGEKNFYITPFGAFKAANLTGELASVLAPLLGALAPLVSDGGGLGNVDAGKAAEAMAGCSAIDGDKLETLMKKLLLGGHVAVEAETEDGTSAVMKLDRDLADEVFCGEVQDMFVLCFEVIRLNFNGFFKRFTTRSGEPAKQVVKKARQII